MQINIGKDKYISSLADAGFGLQLHLGMVYEYIVLPSLLPCYSVHAVYLTGPLH